RRDRAAGRDEHLDRGVRGGGVGAGVGAGRARPARGVGAVFGQRAAGAGGPAGGPLDAPGGGLRPAGGRPADRPARGSATGLRTAPRPTVVPQTARPPAPARLFVGRVESSRPDVFWVLARGASSQRLLDPTYKGRPGYA